MQERLIKRKKVPNKNNTFCPLNIQREPVFSDRIEVTQKVKKNFPYNNAGERKKVAILPSHRAIFRLYEEGGFRNLGKAVRATGAYSESAAAHVSVITKSKSWQALMEEQLPETKLAQRHTELLDKRDTIKIINADGSEELIDKGPETAAVTKGLEMAYKLRGSYKEKTVDKAGTVMYNLFYKPEVREQMKTFEDGLKQSLIHEIARKNRKDMEEEEERTRDIEYDDSEDARE